MGMKRRTLILAGLSAIMLSACQVFFVDDSDTSIVQFSASAGDARTKTEYGGDDGSGWELIKWLDTDQVTIHMSYTDEQNASIFDDPKDYGIKPNPDKDGGHISYGGLVPHSDPLRWHGHFVNGKPQEYAHQFYSTYPAGKGGFSESDHSFTFSLPDKQNGTMDRAYMAAVKEFQQPRASNEEKVQLDYYPLVTAVSVTLTNATGETIENLSKEITLSSGNKALAGAFTAVLSTDRDRYIPGAITGTGNAVTVSATANGLEDTEGITVHMFLLPQDYGTSDLTLKVGDTSFQLAAANTKVKTLESCKKYNISINLKLQNGEITPNPPTIEDIYEDGDAQTILALLSFLLYGPDPNPAFQSYVSGKYPDFSNFYGNNYRNKNPLHVSDLKALYSQYPDVFQWIFDNVTNLSITTNIGTDFKGTITSTVFKLFANLNTISLLFDHGEAEITIEDLPNLKSITLIGNSAVTLIVNNCPSLTEAKKNSNSNTTITVDGKIW